MRAATAIDAPSCRLSLRVRNHRDRGNQQDSTQDSF